MPLPESGNVSGTGFLGRMPTWCEGPSSSWQALQRSSMFSTSRLVRAALGSVWSAVRSPVWQLAQSASARCTLAPLGFASTTASDTASTKRAAARHPIHRSLPSQRRRPCIEEQYEARLTLRVKQLAGPYVDRLGGARQKSLQRHHGGDPMDAPRAHHNLLAGRHHFRFHAPHAHLSSTFGDSWFGTRAEAFARFFGTPTFLVAQTLIVAVWIAVNVAGLTVFDVYPFILLNLAFSLQAAYAAPLILLAQTRQADRDKARDTALQEHHNLEVESQRAF